LKQDLFVPGPFVTTTIHFLSTHKVIIIFGKRNSFLLHKRISERQLSQKTAPKPFQANITTFHRARKKTERGKEGRILLVFAGGGGVEALPA